MALDVYLTNACNLHCRYCFNLDREDAPRVPLDDIRTILTTAYQRGHRYVSVTGGEPFLYKDVFQVLDHAHDAGYWITILTHGGLLDPGRIEALKRYWRLRVRISLDGPDRQTHDLLRGEGTFDHTVGRIRALVRSGINVGIGVTVSEHNLPSLDTMLRFCAELGVAFVRCSPVARVKKGRDAHVEASLHEGLLEAIIRFTLSHPELVDQPQPTGAAPPASIPVLTTRRCMAGKHFLGITPDQKMVPCPLIAEHPAVQSIYFENQTSFDQLGAAMDRLFADMAGHLGGICRTCEFRDVCQGSCLAEKLSFDRALHDEQPVCTKLILERLRDRFDTADFDRLVRSWVWQLQTTLEPTGSHACMRQSPYWSLNFKVGDRWRESALRFH